MRKLLLLIEGALVLSMMSFMTSCTDIQDSDPADMSGQRNVARYDNQDYSSRMPAHMETSQNKVIVVNPNVHAWGAYAADGHLVRAGIATSGGATCPPDADEADCRTKAGTYHITAIRGEDCYSKTFPRPNGGGLMPYCMFFHNGEALHGSPDDIVGEYNISHGCVRMRIPDAEWMVKQFAKVGTKVVIMPYNS